MPGWRMYATRQGFAVSIRSNVILCRLQTAPTHEVVGHLRDAIEARDAPVVVIVHVGTATELPDAVARREAVRLMGERGTQIAAWVVILEGTGFMRSALRSVANTVRLLARPAFPLQVLGTTEAAVEWLSKQTTADVTVEDLAWSPETAARR